MTWPALPGTRAVYEKDGSIVLQWGNAYAMKTFTQSEMALINGHGSGVGAGAVGGSQTTIAIAFPEPRDLKGIFLSTAGENNVGTWQVWTSADTSNCIDGTWTNQGSFTNDPHSGSVQTIYRASINAFPVNGIRGVRLIGNAGGYTFQGGPTIYAFHVYADISGATAGHRLQLWHPTLDRPLTATELDWGDTPRGSSADKTFRVKNMSGTLTATGVTVTPYNTSSANASPSPSTLMSLSTDGSTFGSSINVGSLSPGSITPVYTVRRIIPDTYGLGPWQPALWADATAWS